MSVGPNEPALALYVPLHLEADQGPNTSVFYYQNRSEEVAKTKQNKRNK